MKQGYEHRRRPFVTTFVLLPPPLVVSLLVFHVTCGPRYTGEDDFDGTGGTRTEGGGFFSHSTFECTFTFVGVWCWGLRECEHAVTTAECVFTLDCSRRRRRYRTHHALAQLHPCFSSGRLR
ncbi:hypothetical protein GALMADRAFT_253378 [Galerina marginata CBS 339.88]|uniref:Uncharacterized protein n=1 Tax=Galerina marginata (strain CBS 339.88) TaxID=685588 RepID=A0A067SWT3_GALM3|nr:hypothetical protein GALMADRAFT_253378 [Galerina marginata CBS 339.88]